MTIKTQSLVQPIGLLPEISYGVPLTGFQLNGGHLLGAVTIKITPNFATKGIDEDYLIGLKIQIDKGGGLTSDHIVMSTDSIDTLTIEPPLPRDYSDGDDVNLYFVPIQAKVKLQDIELDTSRDVEGEVGGGMYKSFARQQGKMGKARIEVTAGQDFFHYGSTIFYAYSSLKAYCFTADGKMDNAGVGEIIPRGAVAPSSAIKSFTIAYNVESGQTRVLSGCINKKVTQEFDKDLHSHIRENHDVPFKDVTRTLPSRTLLPQSVYKKYSLRSHGHTTLSFWHGTYLKNYAGPATSRLYVKSVMGFEDNDVIVLKNMQTLEEFTTTITSIDSTNKYFDINPSTPAGKNWTEEDEIIAATGYNKLRRIIKLTLDYDNGGETPGDLRSGEDSPTQGVANASDYMGSMDFERQDTSTYDMQYESTETWFFKLKVKLQYGSSYLIDYQALFKCKPKTNLKEELKAEKEKIIDSLGFQIVDIEYLMIGGIP